MLVSEIMIARVEVIDVNCTAGEALDKLSDLGIRHLPVVQNGDLVGIVSDRDLRVYESSLGEELNQPELARRRLNTKVSAVMHTDIISVIPESDVTELIDIMLEDKVGAVLVVDGVNGRLLGIVSYVDVLQAARDLF